MPEPAPIASAGVHWMSLVNAAVSGNGLVKTGGCSGCPDATAVSVQQLTGSGALEFAYRAEVPFGVGDTFQIEVVNGSVRYVRNGTVFFTSAAAAALPLRVHVVLFDAHAAVGSVALGQGGRAGAAPAPDSPPAAPETPPVAPEPDSAGEGAPALDEGDWWGPYRYFIR